MRYFFLVILFSVAVSAHELPQTVNEAVNIVHKGMSEQKKRQLLMMPEFKLSSYNGFFGMNIRNSFELWGSKNTVLLSDCGKEALPEDCSGLIIRLLWRKLKQEYVNSPLNKTFDAIQSTRIPPYYDKNKGLLKYVQFLNEALSKNPNAQGVVIRAACEDRHYRLKNFVSEYSNSRETYLINKLVYFSLLGQGIANTTIEENEIVLTPLPFLDAPVCEIKKIRKNKTTHR